MAAGTIDTPSVDVRRSMSVFGYHDREGHADIAFGGVRVPKANLVGERGRGFAIAQARLGPGRIHHCMRAIGMAERALELLCRRASSRVADGRSIAEHGIVQDWVADARTKIDQARLYVLYTAWLMQTRGVKAARTEIAAIKAVVPTVAVEVIDRAIQVHGAAGVSQDTDLAAMWALARTLRIVDGPDEVHRMSVARRELARFS